MRNEGVKQRFLSRDEETNLIARWHNHHDPVSATTIINAHMRLAIKIAKRFAFSDVSMDDLVSAARVGMMMALNRFDLTRRVRFSTYAEYWINAEIKQCVYRNLIVRPGSSNKQKALFFGISRALKGLGVLDTQRISSAQLAVIARNFGVTTQKVEDTITWMHNYTSLDATPQRAGTKHGTNEASWYDVLRDETTENPEETALKAIVQEKRHDALRKAVDKLPPRERRIFEQRRLSDEQVGLEALATEFGISKERVRQLENRAWTTVSGFLRSQTRLCEV